MRVLHLQSPLLFPPVAPPLDAAAAPPKIPGKQVVPVNINKETEKQVKSLCAKVKELEEKVLYLSKENDEVRKRKEELQLDLIREKQI